MGFLNRNKGQRTDLPQQSAVISTAPDGSIPPLTGDHSVELLRNTDRGFRAETYYTLGTGEEWPGGGKDGVQALIDKMAYYRADSPMVIQTYIYLCAYNQKELDTLAFDQLKSYLELLREHGWSCLFRFAYESREDKLEGAKDKILRRHLVQLKQFLDENADLFRDVVTAAQLGVLGPWGEGNQSQYLHPRRRTFSAVCDLFPAGVHVQARTMKIYHQASGARTFGRLGFHDDYLFGRPHIWSTAGVYTDTDYYRTFIKNSPLHPNDGEMPWGRAKPDADQIDGRGLICQCYEHRLTTLSLEHNYREPDPQAPFAMEKWKDDFLTPAQLHQMGCPIYDAWFTDAAGSPIQRSVFDYLRDFTGYHLMLSNLKTEPAGSGMRVQLLVTNYGFSAPFALNTAQFVILGADGSERAYPAQGIDFPSLTSCEQQTVTAELPAPGAGERLGLRLGKHLKSNNTYRWVKTANNVPFISGVNLILP